MKNAKLATKAAQGGRSARGVVPLLELWDRWDEGDATKTAALLEGLATDRRLSPPRRVMAQVLHELARARLGEPTALAEPFEKLGYVTHWRLIGPFDNEGKTGFDEASGPERDRMQAPALDASYPGRERPVRWRELAGDITRGGEVSFAAMLRPSENVCGLAETFVHSERKRPLSLWVGAGGAVKVYWNGEEVMHDAAYRQPSRDRSVVMVGAHAGANRLLVKVCVTDDPWAMFVRIGDAKGAPTDGLRIAPMTEAPESIGPGHAQVPLPAAPQAPLATLEAEAARPKPRAQALVDLARYLTLTGSDDPAERRAKQLAEHAADLEPSVDNLVLAARLAEERAEIMRLTARAVALAPNDPEVRMLQARVAAGGPSPEQALPLLDGFDADSEEGLDAALLHATILRDLDLPATGLSVVERAAEHHGMSLRVLRMLADLRQAAGDVDGALAARKAILAWRFDDFGNRRVLITDALQRLEDGEVVKQIDALFQLAPGSARIAVYIASLQDALGRDDLALASLHRALDLAPEAPQTHVAIAQALMRAERFDLAAEALNAALALQPQDAATRELLEHLEPVPREDERYALSPSKLLARRRPSGGYPITVLQDLTVNTVFDNGLGSSFRQWAVQIHDAEGARQHRTFSFPYDPDTQRVQVRLARVYRGGKMLESTQTYEQALGEPWYRIYYDTRAVVVVFPDLEPGDIVELRYRIDDVAHRNLFADYYGDLYTWRQAAPVVHAEYVLITPTSRTFYTNEPKLAGIEHTQTIDGKRRVDRWVAENIAPLIVEDGMPGMTEVSPYLHVSSYAGWQDVGKWYWGLIKDQLYADAALQRTVAELVSGAATVREKVQRIHNWVVKHTRYVALEFGIHGFLPYRVPLIVQRGFGDCKDKASLVYTMLREAGIDARIVLVRTRHNGAIAPSPASLAIFDHAIAYVPELDLYLDATAEHNGTTELPDQDQGVTVLQVGPEGAELRTTPVLDASKNRHVRELAIELHRDGSAVIDGHEEIVGGSAARWRELYEAPGTRAERLERELSTLYPGLELREQSFEDLDALESPVRYRYRIQVPQLAPRTDEGLQLAASSLDDLLRTLARAPQRRQALELGSPTTYTEHRSVQLPAGMQAATLPAGGEARSAFGSLVLQFEQGARGPSAHTELVISRDRVAPADYPAFRRWVERADELLRQRILLRQEPAR